MRGSCDLPLTKLLYENGLFLDKRSYIGYRKEDMTPHLYLWGNDKENQRDRVCQLADWTCKKCGFKMNGYVGGEWDHIQGGYANRCDCLHNSQWLCQPCHRAKHVRVRFGEGRKQAEKEQKDQD